MRTADPKDMMKRTGQLKDYRGDDQIVTSYDLQEILKQEVPLKVFNSKIPSLDTAIEGFEPGELIVISGPRKSGKTLLAQSLTQSFIDQEVRSLWFSYELTPRQFLSRFNDIPFFVLPLRLKPYALEWVEDRILEALSKHGIQVVFIDHLHFLFDMARSRSPSIEIGQIIRWLKSVAIELNLVIFVMCHLQKTKENVEPDDSNIRDSSFVSQESDTGLILWRVKHSENHAWLKVCYSRRTGVIDRKIPLIKIRGLLRERQEGDI